MANAPKSTTDEKSASPNLPAIYPVPKTYEQHQQDQRKIEELRQQRRPKQPVFKGGLFTSLIFGALIIFVGNIEKFLALGILGVSCIFGVTIGFCLAANACYKYLRDTLYAYGLALESFAVPYLLTLTVLIGILINLPRHFLVGLLVAVVRFAAVLLILRFITKKALAKQP